jgi:orotidine-5'-phosphate decarboxylase
MQSVGIDLQQWVDRGLLEFRCSRPSILGLEAHLFSMQRSVDVFRPTVVVMDPVSDFLRVGTAAEVAAMLMRQVDFLKGRGVTVVTVHGNQAIMEAAAGAAQGFGILAVTVLTSLDRGDLDDLGFDCDVEELVLSRARRALAAGCAGVVSSGLEAKMLRAGVDDRLIVVTPGIRPGENRPADDQKRVVSVQDAFANGADYIVVGRPIRDAADPRAAAESIQATIAGLFPG